MDRGHDHERELQRRLHAVLSDPQRRWRTTDGSDIAIVAAGRVNVHAGPDFRDVAILHKGTIYVGDAEFHRRSSDWYLHQHDHSQHYASVLLHLVFEDDVAIAEAARWTLRVSPEDVASHSDRQFQHHHAGVALDEVQHLALLRLCRQTAEMSVLIQRLGVPGALVAATQAWAQRFHLKRRRPTDPRCLPAVVDAITTSPLGKVVLHFSTAEPHQTMAMLERAERQRIACEGCTTRREILVNVIVPLLIARASMEQRVVLLQWYWSAEATVPYGGLRRRFPDHAQNYVWQQQGLLEYVRMYGRRTVSCADTLRSYRRDHLPSVVIQSRASGDTVHADAEQ